MLVVNCPESYSNVTKTTVGIVFMDSCAVVTAFVHPYVVYCIIFRSTPAMKTYKWYLLWHQVCCCAGDLFVNVAAKPFLFFPLSAGYIRGIAKNLISAKTALAAGVFLVSLANICNQHLFTYRYCAITGKSQLSPVIGSFLAWSYFWTILSFYLNYTANTDTYKTIEEWKQLYSICVYEALMSVPGIVAYDRKEMFLKTFVPLLYGITAFCSWLPYFTLKCLKGIKVEHMSDNLKRMHRKFLIQLIIQGTIPFTLTVIPISLFMLAIGLQIFGMDFINDLVWCAISMFGVSGGIVLIIMNPTYHNWLTKHLQYQRTTVVTLPSSIRLTTPNYNTTSIAYG